MASEDPKAQGTIRIRLTHDQMSRTFVQFSIFIFARVSFPHLQMRLNLCLCDCGDGVVHPSRISLWNNVNFPFTRSMKAT
jgi:hypothetical protein